MEPLPFLDILLHYVDGSLKCSVYSKPTHSGSYLHFFSYHPLCVKKSIVSSIYRVYSNEFLDSEINYIFDNFGKLGYPRYLLKQALSMARKKHGQLVEPRENRNENDRNSNMLIVPFN